MACSIAVLLFALIYLAPATRGRGPEMDEGAVVAYAARVLDGAVPHRDFLTFYGPGNLWLVGGAFAVFGESVGTERGVGLLYRLLIVLALFLLGHRIGGVLGGVLAGVVATLVMAPELVWAYATYGALAFGLLALALMAWASRPALERWAPVLLAAGGFAGGLALLVRVDFAPATALGALAVLLLVPRRDWRWVGVGLVVPLLVLAAHLAIVGSERLARVVSDLLASGSGRSLPVPRPWVYPGNLLAFATLAMFGVFLVGALLWRRRPDDPVPRVLVGTSVFALALLPYALSRPDAFHIRSIAVVPLALLPAVALYLVATARLERAVAVAAAVAIAFVTAVGAVVYGDLSHERARELRGLRTAYRGFEDDDNQAAIRAVLTRIRSLAPPGDSVFVGPQDLRRTNYGPTYMYFLLPELAPASYYMEMNPGTANREGSGLADDLRGADWLILTSEWDDWNEPNDSSVKGPAEPNQVVRDEFCLRFGHGAYRLYERCDRAA